MKKLLLLLLCVPLIFSCGEKEKKSESKGKTLEENDLNFLNFKGKIKSVKQKTYAVKTRFGEVEKDYLISEYIKKFNREGNLTEYSLYRADLITDGLLLESRNIYQYNEDGKLIERITYNADGELTQKIKIKYDKDGNRTEQSVYNTDGELIYKAKWKYDKDGNRTEQSVYIPDEELTPKSKYKYDKDGNRAEESAYNTGGELINKSKYKYDKDGNMTEETSYNADGELDWKNKYQYDEFDKLNNWTVKIEDEHFRPTAIVEREIEYYE